MIRISGHVLPVILAVLSFGTITHAADKPQKPNVLFLVADDLNNDLGCYGHPLVKTPHLDRLAKRGVLFERTYCQNPVCNPSRTSFLSGKRSGTRVKEGAAFLPNHFRAHGYFTAEMSKLTHSYGISATAVSWDVEERTPTAAKLAELAAQAKSSGKPFFIGVGLTHTHPGFSYQREHLQLYPPEKITFPKEPSDFRQSIPDVAYEKINVQQLSDEDRRKHIAKYYAAISTLDAKVGELLKTLEELKLTDDTIIIFTSDHGRHLGEHGGVYDKRTLFEASARVPLIVAAPGKPGGDPSPRLVELVDLFPTLTELCNIPTPQELEGTSLVPLLHDPKREWKSAAFTVSRTGGRSIRTDRYRYAEWKRKESTSAFLFDYQTDPGETKNLADDPQHAGVIRELKQQLDAGWRAAVPQHPGE